MFSHKHNPGSEVVRGIFESHPGHPLRHLEVGWQHLPVYLLLQVVGGGQVHHVVQGCTTLGTVLDPPP